MFQDTHYLNNAVQLDRKYFVTIKSPQIYVFRKICLREEATCVMAFIVISTFSTNTLSGGGGSGLQPLASLKQVTVPIICWAKFVWLRSSVPSAKWKLIFYYIVSLHANFLRQKKLFLKGILIILN